MHNYQNEIKKINEAISFDELYEFAKKKNYLKFIKKYFQYCLKKITNY